MSARLLIECGAAETRAAHVIDDLVTQFWFGPAIGDENLPQPPSRGDIFVGRITSVSASLKAAFVDIGAARQGFLALRNGEKPPVEGDRTIVVVHRPPIDDKGARLSRDWKSGLANIAALEDQAKAIGVGRLGPPAPAPIVALIQCGPEQRNRASAVFVDHEAARRLLDQYGAGPVAISSTVFRDADVDQAIEEALGVSVALPGGARLSISEAPAGVMIDVDTGASGDGASATLNDKVNLLAADRILIELSRRAIGGRVVVDFLPPTTTAARHRLAERMRSGLGAFDGARFGKLATDGLADFTLRRSRLSLLEAATEPAGGWPVPGRRFTLDWSAKAAVRDLERALRAQPSARLRLLVGADIASYLKRERPQWTMRLAERFGARFVLEPAASMEPRQHDVA